MKLSAKEWQSHVIKQQQSGLSVSAYAKSSGLSPANLLYWCGKSRNKNETFLPVAVKALEQKPRAVGLAIRLPSGIELLVQTPLSSVTEIVQSLMRVRP